MKPSDILDKINRFLKNYFAVTYDLLKTHDNLIFKTHSSCKAINYRRNDNEEVGVVKLAENFYVYIEVRFTHEYKNKHISISIFHGEEYESRKNQLFRAEWDDYMEDLSNHPQPHWHITRDKAHEVNFAELMNDEIEQERDFIEYYKMSDKEIFDTKKIHFAMSAMWHLNNDGVHLHKMDSADRIVDWMRGVLDHVKCEITTVI